MSFEDLIKQEKLDYSQESMPVIQTDDYTYAYESINLDALKPPTDEKEYNKACSIESFDVLKNLGVHEDIEQWTVFIDPTTQRLTKGTMRVRRTYSPQSNTHSYTSTDKLVLKASKNDGYSERKEYPVNITKEHFDTRKALSDNGQLKRRYKKTCELEGPFKGLVWEIDVFYNKQGELTKCCMVEMEVSSAIEADMPLPEGFTVMTDLQYQVAKQNVFSITH